MSSIPAGLMLAYLAGAAFFACAVMSVYWSVRCVPAGFGPWTVSLAFIGVGCLLLADPGHFPQAFVLVVAPSLILTGVVLRLEGLGQYLGYRSMGGWPFLLPAATIVLISIFAYVRDDPAIRVMIVAAAIGMVLLFTTALLLVGTRHSHTFSSKVMAVGFGVYGILWLASGAHWLVTGEGFPADRLDIQSMVFFAGATLFEFFGLIGALVLSARWNAEALEAAHGATEKERKQLADIVAFLPDATFVLDKDCKVVAWNRLAEEKTHISASEIVGTRLDESALQTAGDDGTTLSEVLLDPGKSIPARYYDVRLDDGSLSGEEEWHHSTMPEKSGHFWHLARLLRNSDGEVTGAIESVRDITSRVRAEEAIRESEERYRSLFDHSLDGILVIAPGGAVVDANPSACRILRMSKEEICAADPGSLIGHIDRTEFDLQGQMTQGAAVREMEFLRGDGSAFPAECMSVVWNDSVGHLRAFVQFRDISERVEVQNMRRASEASLLEGVTASCTGSWEIDLVGRSIWLSSGALRVFGITGHSPYFPLETASLAGLTEDSTVLDTELRRVMDQGGSYNVEYSITRADDRASRRVHSIGTGVCNAEGATVRVVGLVQDVTESQLASHLPQPDVYALAHSDDQIYWVDSEGRIVNVNQAACTQLGYSRDELLAMNVYELNPSLQPGASRPLETVKNEGMTRVETTHRTKSGRNMPVELIITHGMYSEGEEYKFVVAKDISERKRLEENLRRTQLSLGRGGDAIIWADADGQLAFATDSACDKLGIPREELLSLNIRDVDVRAVEEWNRIRREVLEHGSLVHRTSYRTRSGKTRPMEALFSHVEHDGKDYVLVVLCESGERQADGLKSTEVDLGELQHRELEVVGQLAGGIAHDFNNLLTAIIGYGDLILGGEGSQNMGALHRDAEEIRNAAERAAALVSQITAFARRQPLCPRKVSLGDAVSDMEPRLRRLLTGDVQFSVGVSDEAGVVEVDTDQLERVVVNLVTNAQEAMPEGGRLHIAVDNVDLDEDYCRSCPELRAGAYAVLSVSDTGAGMDAATRLRIFEPFFTTKPPGEGPGLGLAVVYGLVRQSGGSVAAYSEVDKGTTMKVYLPRLSALPEEPPHESVPTASTGTRDEIILVVEDEPPLRRLVCRVLRHAGYRVFVAGSGPEALELLDDLVAPPELLITDVVLPGGLQGNELADRLTSRLPGLSVLYMSGHPRDTIVHAGRLDEGVNFLSKPFSPVTLASKVREVLESGPRSARS